MNPFNSTFDIEYFNDDFENKLNEYIKSEALLRNESFKYPLSDFADLIYEGFAKSYTKLIEKQIKDCWKSNLNNLNRCKKYPFEISYNGIIFKNKNQKLIDINLKDKIYELIELIDLESPLGVKISAEDKLLKFSFDYSEFFDKNCKVNTNLTAKNIYLLVFDYLTDMLKEDIFYLPSINELLYSLNDTFIKTDSPYFKKDVNHSKINMGARKGYFYDLACELEDELYHGEIKIKKGNLKNEVIFLDKKNNLEFELSLISSSTLELIPFIIYLKYHLNKADTLIIEEIEKHIHPQNQVLLVKYLTKAINKGLNIILTTQSDYILEKINNLIYLGNCKANAFNKLKYSDDCVLNYDEVCIYHFKRNEDYDYTPHSVDINFTGFIDNNFKPVIDEMHEEADVMIDNKLR